ncbi:flotillin-1 [Elysia marginata]|uniref:Flotillin-1 n=1 Tax=Elysia marginata TaxID=1093978 RepID=A0AAV4EJ76_9GAST|nr:flotillin-1 [Elysia marginata]
MKLILQTFIGRVVTPPHFHPLSYCVHICTSIMVKVQGGNEKILQSACELFLGKSEADIKKVARETLEGHQRAILGQMTVEIGNSARFRSEVRRFWGRRTVVPWASNTSCKNKSATETPTNTVLQQALDGTPSTRADMPSMKVKGQNRKEAFDPTWSMTQAPGEIGRMEV